MWFNGYPALKAAAPQDSDPATQALRGPNSLKTTKSKTDTNTTGSGKQSPPDVNTDAMRGFHNPDYAEQDGHWVRTLPETSVDKEDVVGSLVTEDELNRHMKRRAMADAFGYWGLPFSDATAGEFETTRNELAGRIPEGLGFSVADIHHMNQGVILDDKQLVAHGGGTEEQRQRVRDLNFTKQLLSILFKMLPIPKFNVIENLLGTDSEMKEWLKKFMKYESAAEDYLNVLSAKSGIDLNSKVYQDQMNRLREKAKRTEKALASVRKGDIYYRVFLKNLPGAQKKNTLQIPDAYTQTPIQAPGDAATTQRELILYFRKEGGREKLMFIMRTDTMEVIWP